MKEVLLSLDWNQVIYTLWSVILLPVLTYVGKQIHDYAKERKLDNYTEILYKNVVNAVKDVYETIVKDIKETSDWTEDKQHEVKELAKNKAISALTISMYQALKLANNDFEEYLDGLVGTALYDLKRANK